jgi:hypothetical protein
MNWGTLKLQIGRKVNDPLATKYAASILDNANAALTFLASIHTGVASVSDYVGDGSTTAYSLPGNCVEDHVVGVYDVTNDVWLHAINWRPGNAKDEGYYIWPTGTLNINPAPTNNATLRVYYVAYYDEIQSDSDSIAAPQWAFEPVALYAAARVLEANIEKIAQQRNYATKVDSGNPEHLPELRVATRYMKEFWELINAQPARKDGR